MPRKSKLRDTILSFLGNKSKPLSVPEILARVQKKRKKTNKTSIYRALEILTAQNLVTEIDFGEGKKRYETANLGHHHHLICKSCNKVEDIFLKTDLEKVQKNIKREKAFNMISHTLEFFGLCPKCQLNN